MARLSDSPAGPPGVRRADRAGGLLLAAAVLLAAVAAVPLGAAAQQPDLIDFRLEDQFERSWSDEDFAGRVVVVLAGDRGGAEFSEAWGQALHERVLGTELEDRLAAVPVALVDGVPFFLKGTVRGYFSDDTERWVLLDWDGVFEEHYALVEGHANLLVFAPDRTFERHMVVQDVVPTLLDDLVKALERLASGGSGSDFPRKKDESR